MPHLTLEYTANLEFDVQKLLGQLHKELASTGAINLKGIKSRAYRLSDYRIADGNPDYAFVHIGLLIHEGRSIETQKGIAQTMMNVLKAEFHDRQENGFLSLSVDIQEMKKDIAQSLHNIPDKGIPQP